MLYKLTPRSMQSLKAFIYADSMSTLIQTILATEDPNLRSVYMEFTKLEEVLEWKRPAMEVELLVGVVKAHALVSRVHALTCYVLMSLLCMLPMICLRP